MLFSTDLAFLVSPACFILRPLPRRATTLRRTVNVPRKFTGAISLRVFPSGSLPLSVDDLLEGQKHNVVFCVLLDVYSHKVYFRLSLKHSLFALAV
jgi:hypothetical protein